MIYLFVCQFFYEFEWFITSFEQKYFIYSNKSFFMFERLSDLFEHFINLSERRNILFRWPLYAAVCDSSTEPKDFFFKIVIMLQSYYSRHSDLRRFKWLEFLTFRINKCAHVCNDFTIHSEYVNFIFILVSLFFLSRSHL